MVGGGHGQDGERRAPWVPAGPGAPTPQPPPAEAAPPWSGTQAFPPATGPHPPWTGPVAGFPASPEPEPSGNGRTALWAGVGLGVLVLVGGGTWLVLELLFGGGGTAATAPPAATTSASTDAGAGADPTQTTPEPDAPAGPAGPLQVADVQATCEAEPGVDAAGNAIVYSADMVVDGQQATAWRCEGSAVGQRIVFDFGRPVTIQTLGLVPGYAKVDPTDGTDRFTQNHTVTGVTWYFDDASAVEQVVPDPRPAFDTLRLDEPVVTTEVVLEIASTGNPGAERPFTPVGEVVFVGW